MHPSRCAAQREVAQRGIRQHVTALAKRFRLKDMEIPMAVNLKQPDVAAMEMEMATERMLAALVKATAPAEAPPKEDEPADDADQGKEAPKAAPRRGH